jgi:hypothetical protein
MLHLAYLDSLLSCLFSPSLVGTKHKEDSWIQHEFHIL